MCFWGVPLELHNILLNLFSKVFFSVQARMKPTIEKNKAQEGISTSQKYKNNPFSSLINSDMNTSQLINRESPRQANQAKKNFFSESAQTLTESPVCDSTLLMCFHQL